MQMSMQFTKSTLFLCLDRVETTSYKPLKYNVTQLDSFIVETCFYHLNLIFKLLRF